MLFTFSHMYALWQEARLGIVEGGLVLVPRPPPSGCLEAPWATKGQRSVRDILPGRAGGPLHRPLIHGDSVGAAFDLGVAGAGGGARWGSGSSAASFASEASSLGGSPGIKLSHHGGRPYLGCQLDLSRCGSHFAVLIFAGALALALALAKGHGSHWRC